MENSVKSFEQLFNSKSARKTSIYNSNPTKQPTYRPQDVLDKVFSQIKSIQQADSVKNSKSKLSEKKSGFLVVENKPVYKEVPKHHKFETQCVTDTQLINIIENVEAIDAHRGITQEFNNTFIHTHFSDEISTKIDKDEDTVSEIKAFDKADVNEDKTQTKIEEIENTHANIKEDSSTDVFIHRHIEKDKKSMKLSNEAMLSNNILNITEANKINIYKTNPQSRDNNVTLVFTKSHKEKDENSVKINNVHSQSLIEINTVNVNKNDKTNANVNNTNTQREDSDVINAFTQGHIERDKNTLTVSKTSSDDSPSILADVNVCVLDEQLDTEDIANINGFEIYNTVPEFRLNNQEKPAENINQSKELFTEDQLLFDEGEEIEKERTPSPVLNIKTKKVKCLKTPESFSVPLDVFENFEKTFVSLVENKDKHIVINSQILENELCFNLNTYSIKDDSAHSPVFELFNDELQISKREIKGNNNNKSILAAKTDPIDEIMHTLTQESFLDVKEINIQDNNKTTVTKVENIKNMIEKRSESLKDEILFSSDEEIDCTHKEMLDLPLTCALETSFNDEPDILEKTMYVGFQTASNKSIQIQTDTFEKARSMLSNDREFSLTELVEMCDDNANNINLTAKTDPVLKTESKSQSIEDKNKKISGDKVDTIMIPKRQIGFEFVGFQTANNKKINISKRAMTKISNVFKDIDLTETFLDSKGKIESIMPKNKEPRNKDSNQTDTNKNYTNIQEDNDINDDLLIEEFENIEMSLEEKEANEIKTDFEGFKTASNKKIKISDKALLTINNIFQDIDLTELHEDVNNPIYNINEEIKTYPINCKAMETTEYKHYLGDVAFPSTSKATFEGFKTANNKMIKVSDIALSKTKNVFKDINDSEILVNNDKSSKNKNFDCNDTNQKFKGFKTASNKSVLISKEALIKSKQIFQELEINDNLNTTELTKNTGKVDDLGNIHTEISQNCKDKQGEVCNDHNNPEIPVFQGFKTASNKPVKVSEKSLAKTKHIFEDINLKMNSLNDGENNNATSKDIGVLKGFQTANNNPVIISEKNLIKSRKIFEELDENNSNVEMKIDANEKQPYPTNFNGESLSFKGYTTENNELVKISEESLAKSKSIFCDNDKTNAIENKPYAKTNQVSNPVFKGFQTANKKPANISEEALLRSKKIFQDIKQNDQENMNINASTDNIGKTSSFIGFKTGNNEEVLISEDALEKSEINLIDHEESTSNKTIIRKNKVQFTGFQTANNKNVKISKEAMEKTKNIFKDINVDKNDTKKDISQHTDTENDKNNCNIQNETNLLKHNILTTTSNTVSEKALKKSKQSPTESIKNDLKNVESEQTLTESVNIEPRTTNTSIIDKIINTQVLNNFEDNLCTEDFQSTPRAPKRSTSPILSCPRAKKRKFETPYKPTKQNTNIIKKIEPAKPMTTNFEENYKKNKIFKLKDLKTVKTMIDPYITNFNFDNIHNFEFVAERNDITHTKITVSDIKEIFQNGVDTKIIPEGWIDIHIKLIIWKLLSYEVKFNFKCTVRNIINQLKYRYDKELYKAERPALRKIMEKDDVASKTLVLCVAGIYIDGVSVQNVNTTDNIELLLTDGWYLIKTNIDKMLSKLVYEKKIYIGCKIVTNGAELLNCEQGVSPWEDTSQIKLKIFGNSTRLAAWDTKLGFHKSAILTNLTAVRIDGGKICKIQVFVTRVYPLLYVEKFEDGSTVTRSERLEHLHQIKYENDREAILEQIYEEVQKEFSDQESQDSESYMESGIKRKLYDSGSQIAKMMKKCKDPMEFRAQLTTSQVQLLQEHTSKNRDRLISAIQDRIKDRFGERNVVTLARGKIASVGRKGDQITVCTGMLSIWKPNDAILELFKENSWIEIMNVIPTAIRYSEVQLSAGRQSIFRQSKPKDESLTLHLEKYKRKIFKIENLTKEPVNDNEIDTVGLIFLIEPSIEDFDSTKHFQNVYLADENKNMICINFWGGIKKFGFLNVIDTGQIISCVNLQKRAGNTRKNIPQFRVTEFTSLTKTPKNAQCRQLIEDLNKKLGTDRVKFCEDCVAIQSNYSILKCFDENSPYRINRSDYNISKNKMFIETPLRNTKKDEFNLTGLDFESTFKQTDTELSPNTLLRKKRVNEKIEKLKRYGEPPPLSPINIINKSKNATKSYKSPLMSKDDSFSNIEENVTIPNNVLTDKNVAENSKSPIFNKTYVKRTVNPIKLDFSKNIEQDREETDSFAGDFDGSPPLSLE